MEYFEQSVIDDFFSLLNENHITYVLIKNIARELPARLKQGKDIDILVHVESLTAYHKLMHSHGYIEIIHPKGKEAGWKFLYGIHENSMRKHLKTGLEIDAYAELCTKSFAMNAWLPLDQCINYSIWKDKIWDETNHWWKMDDVNLVVYLLTRCIFEKGIFSESYIQEIEERKHLLQMESCVQRLEKIFFRFTPYLIEAVMSREYASLIGQYACFVGY